MKKILVLLTAFFSMFQIASAQNVSDDLVISTQDGNSVAYNLSTRPVVTFDATDLVLTASDVVVRYPIADVKDITFMETTDNAIGEVKGLIAFIINDNSITVQGLNNGDRLQVFGTDGKAITNVRVNTDGTATADISSLGHGVFVVKAGRKSYKILR